LADSVSFHIKQSADPMFKPSADTIE